MIPRQKKAALLSLPVLIMLAAASWASALEPVDWLSQDFGRVHVFSRFITEEEDTLLMDGVLQFAYPQGFQIHYYTLEGPVTITSQDGFVQVQAGSDVQYGYDRYWLFEDVENYLFSLAEYARLPWKFAGRDQVAGRPTQRFKVEGEPQLVVWFHEGTGLPFLLRQGSRTLLSVASFTLDPLDEEAISQVELNLSLTSEPARITLEWTEEGWVPTKLIIEEALGRVELEFSGWAFAPEWEGSPLPILGQLKELNEQFLVQFDAKDWESALETSQELLALAPQFWQAYLYRAFVYEALGNYLGVVENYQQVLMRQPDHPLALNNLAYHYLLREVHIPQALEMAERAVELERRDIYLDTLGYGYYLVGRFAEAKELLLEALATAPEDAVPEITEHLNLVLAALGEADE